MNKQLLTLTLEKMINELIGIACDHAGYQLKLYLIKYLLSNKYEIVDFGTNSNDSVDYADYIHPLAKKIDDGEILKGIIICGSGNGVAMTANKYRHIRAALCWNKEIAELGRKHNNANILALPARFINNNDAQIIVDTFLNTEFEGGRHSERIEKISKLL